MAKPIKTAQRRPDGTFGRPEHRFEQVPDKDRIIVQATAEQLPSLVFNLLQLQAKVVQLEAQLKEVTKNE